MKQSFRDGVNGKKWYRCIWGRHVVLEMVEAFRFVCWNSRVVFCPTLFVFYRLMILRMIGLNTSALQAKNTTTTAEQKFHNGKNQKSGWKGICVCLFSLYKEQILLSSFKTSWAYLIDYCYKRLWSKSTVFLPLPWPLAPILSLDDPEREGEVWLNWFLVFLVRWFGVFVLFFGGLVVGYFCNVSELNWYTEGFDKHWCKEAMAGVCVLHLWQQALTIVKLVSCNFTHRKRCIIGWYKFLLNLWFFFFLQRAETKRSKQNVS